MRKKKLILYLVTFIFFLTCVVTLNNKYDRFYRINGMTNENRTKIERYLSHDEQEYLIQNAFPLSSFLRFLELKDFNLFDLQFYHQIEKKYDSKEDPQWTVAYTNTILLKLRAATKDEVVNDWNQLLSYDLCDLFITCDAFNLEHMQLYIAYQKERALDDEAIALLNELQFQMENQGYDQSKQLQFIKTYNKAYRLQDLVFYMQDPSLTLVLKPSTLTTILSPTTTVASYEPSSLEIPYDVSRMRFSIYLRKDACRALEELNVALNEACPNETLLLVEGFVPYDSLKQEGDREAQLGLSIEVMSLGILYDQFDQTSIYQFLMEHGYEYGFIQRYDENTHIFRYVGKDVAKLLRDSGMRLEIYEEKSDE